MKRIFLAVGILLLSTVFSCELLDESSPSKTGDKLIDTTLNVSQYTAIISIKEGVTIEIPKGLTNDDFELIIRTVDDLPDAPETMNIHMTYDIEVSFGDEFEDYITIRYDLGQDVFTDKEKSDFAFGFYNESEKKWQMFSDYDININGSYAECRTSHLTTVGFIEFITTGGYPYKFSKDGFTVYYTLKDGAPMDNMDYDPSDQSWHIKPGEENYAPYYIQDVAHYLAEAKDAFEDNPYNLEVSDGNINVYVTDLNSNDGEYGSISGAIYLNNKTKLPTGISGISNEDVLKATCAHELLHLVQDNYYVMNKGKIGLWWLEATATQADRMVWGNSLTYSESEIFSIESNAALLENLSKSWDDCNKDPNWYLSGCFLQYLSNYREGSKLNIGNSIKAGGSNTLSLLRVILNEQVKNELNSNVMDEYLNYVVYLFTEGNEKLSAFPLNKDFSGIETAKGLTEQVKMSKTDNTKSVSVSLPYLATKIISVANIETSEMKINYECSAIDPNLEAYLCEVDAAAGKLKIVDNIYKGKSGDIDLGARTGGSYESFVILLVNTGFTEGNKDADFTFTTNSDFTQFSFLEFKLEGDTGDIKYSNGEEDNEWHIGFAPYKGYDTDRYHVISKSFSGNKIKLTLKETQDFAGEFTDYVSTLTVEGEYTTSEFTNFKITEEITKLKEVWSDDKSDWVNHTITEHKEFEYEHIPFSISANDYDYVYTHIQNDNSIIKSSLLKISHTIREEDEDGSIVEDYSLQPINWSSLPSYFSLTLITSK